MDYNMSEMITGCVALVAGASVAISYFTMRYLTKREHIKAETMLKLEEMRAKNRLELQERSNGNLRLEELMPQDKSIVEDKRYLGY